MNWPTVPLSELCYIQSGGTPSRSSPEYYGGNVPWAKISDIDKADGCVTETEEYLTSVGLNAIRGRVFPSGSLLLAMYGSIGKAAFAGKSMATNQAILGIQLANNDRLYLRFLYWWLQQSKPELELLARGVTQKNLSATLVRNLLIPLPALDEQKRIAAILDKADAIRRKREQAIQLADEFLRSLFLDMFGDPVRNPKGWPIRTIGEVTALSQYGTAEKTNSDPSGIPVLRMNNITYDGRWSLRDLKYLPNVSEYYTLEPGDLLFNRTNSQELVGKAAVWSMPGNFAFAGYLIRVKFKRDIICPFYAGAYLNSAFGKRLLLSVAQPSINMSNISASTLRRLPIPVPPLDLQAAFHRAALNTERFLTEFVRSSEYGQKLKSCLSNLAFSGKTRQRFSYKDLG